MKVRNPVVIHWVHEMDRAVRFYEGLFDAAVLSRSPGWSVLDVTALQLGLHLVEPATTERPLRDAGLNLEVDDLDAATTAVSALGGTVTTIREAEPQLPIRVALCRDPDGNAFELRQPS